MALDINNINQLAQLAGLLNNTAYEGKYTNPDDQEISFHVLNAPIPIESYISGIINTYKLLESGIGLGGAGNINEYLFNTYLSATEIEEVISRKISVNQIPYANYNQINDQGVNGSEIKIHIIFSGTEYLTAYNSFIQVAFAKTYKNSYGVLNHPLYDKVKNVLPRECRVRFRGSLVNTVVLEVTFVTADITHLTNNLPKSILAEISKWYIGVENASGAIGNASLAAQGLANNLLG